MWKNNRPEGFKNPHLYFGSPHTEFEIIANGKHEAYEAGADAKLEGLRKGATRVNNIGDLPKGKGVLVFIPGEK